MVKLPNDERVIIVALGESGTGKSNLLNLMINSPGEKVVFFPEGEGAEQCTTEPQDESGSWRGDPMRQVTLVDTPGVGGEGGPREDKQKILESARFIRELSYVNTFLVVVKSGQFRFLSQHQTMFETFEQIFGANFWDHVVLNVSWPCFPRDRACLENWVAKLRDKFPKAAAAPLDKVFVDSPSMEYDTLETLWDLCAMRPAYSCSNFNAGLKDNHDNSSQETSSSSPMPTLSPLPSPVSTSPLPPSVGDRRPPRPPSLAELRLDLQQLLPPPSATAMLASGRPPRSPTYQRRRLSRTAGGSRSFLPTSRDEFSLGRYSAVCTPRSSRRRSTFRDISPTTYSVPSSCRTSRESSPSTSSQFKTVGIPTYLRTSYAYNKPFVKAMRESRLAVSFASEDEVELFQAKSSIAPINYQYLDAVYRLPCDMDLFYVAHNAFELLVINETVQFFDEQKTFSATSSIESELLLLLALEGVEALEDIEDQLVEVEPPEQPEKSKARKLSVPDLSAELCKPDAIQTKHCYNLIKKALLPKVKYHWDQGFRQGASGWEKVPVVKLKIKYNEEDKDLLPAYISIDGGRWCESKRLRLDGCKAKAKLRATKGPDIQLRGIPLDKEQRQECWVPEFLFSISGSCHDKMKERSHQNSGENPGESDQEKEERWAKATVSPAMPE